jgi:hypothetical protein
VDIPQQLSLPPSFDEAKVVFDYFYLNKSADQIHIEQRVDKTNILAITKKFSKNMKVRNLANRKYLNKSRRI